MLKSFAKVAGNVLKTNAGKGAALFGAGAIAGKALDGGSSGSTGGGGSGGGSDNSNNTNNISGMLNGSNVIPIVIVICIILYIISKKNRLGMW